MLEVIHTQEVLGKEFKVYGDLENPLFLAKDVAEWIEHSNPRMMLQKVDEEEKVVNNVYTLGGSQKSWFLTEDGLYEVLMQSRKPIAKSFKKQVKEILKTIRKKGVYMTDEKAFDILNNPNSLADLLLQAGQQLKEKELIIEEKESVIEEMKPKVQYHDDVLKSDSGITMTEIAKDYGKSPAYMNKLLHELGFIYKVNGNWVCYAQYQKEHYQTTDIKSDYYGRPTIVYKWTQKGRKKIHDILAEKGILTLDEMKNIPVA